MVGRTGLKVCVKDAIAVLGLREPIFSGLGHVSDLGTSFSKDLVTSILIDPSNESGDDHDLSASSVSDFRDSINEDENGKEGYFTNYMSKVLELALSKLKVSLESTKLIVIIDDVNLEIEIGDVEFYVVDGVRFVEVKSIIVKTGSPNDERTSENNSDNEDEHDNDALEKSGLMDSMMFTHEEASSIYMSATSNQFASTRSSSIDSSNPKLNTNNNYNNDSNIYGLKLISINYILLKFKGSNLHDTSIEIDEIDTEGGNFPNILVDVLQFLKRYLATLAQVQNSTKKKSSKNKNKNNKKPNNKSKEDENYEKEIPEDDADFSFSSFQLNKLTLHLNPISNETTETENNDNSESHTQLILQKIEANMNKAGLIYGNISHIEISNLDSHDKIFQFISNNNSKSISNTAHDIKFEYWTGSQSSNGITILCPKNTEIKLTENDLKNLWNMYLKLSPCFDILSSIGSTPSNSTINYSPSSDAKVPFILQTGVHNINISLPHSNASNILDSKSNNNLNLGITIYPISFDNYLKTSKIIIKWENNEISINKTRLISSSSSPSPASPTYPNKSSMSSSSMNSSSMKKQYGLQFYGENGNEVRISASTILKIDSVLGRCHLSRLQALIDTFQSFSNSLPSKPIVNTATTSFNGNKSIYGYNTAYGGGSIAVAKRKVRMNMNSTILYPPTPSVNLFISINRVAFSLNCSISDSTSLNGIDTNKDQFGTLTFDCRQILTAFYANDTIQSSILDILILRSSDTTGLNSDPVFEPLIKKSNPNIKDLPMLFLKTSNTTTNLTDGKSEKFINVYPKNFVIEYFTKWLAFLDKDDEEKIYNEDGQYFDVKDENDSDDEKEIGKLNIRVNLDDFSIGLNPYQLQSKAILVVKKGTLHVTVTNGTTLAKSVIRSASIFVIDDNIKGNGGGAATSTSTSTLNGIGHGRVPNSTGNDKNRSQISWYKQCGYVPVASLNSVHLETKINNYESLRQHPHHSNFFLSSHLLPLIDINISISSIVLEACADSMQAFLQLSNDLKLPVRLETSQKFKTTVEKDINGKFLNVFDNVDDSAFKYPKQYESSTTAKSVRSFSFNSDDMEFVDSNVPQLDLVESYYGDKTQTLFNSSLRNSVRNKLGDVSTLMDSNANILLDREFNELAVSFTKDHETVSGSSNSLDGVENSTVSIETTKEGDPPNPHDSLQFNNNYFNQSLATLTGYKPAKIIPMALRLLISNAKINLYDGYDWEVTRDSINNAVKRVQARVQEANINLREKILKEQEIERIRGRQKLADDFSKRKKTVTHHDDYNDDDEDENEETQVIGEYLYDSIHVALPVGSDPSRLRKDINRNLHDDEDTSSIFSNSTATSTTNGISTNGNGHRSKHNHKHKVALRRSKYYKVQVEAKDINVEMLCHLPSDLIKTAIHQQNSKNEIDPDDEDAELITSVNVRIKDLEILDNVPTSTWNKFVTYLREAGQREIGADMIHFAMDTVRPVPTLDSMEYRIKVNVLPLRLHVDQDTLEFLTRFGEFKDPRFLPNDLSSDDDEIPFIQRFKINSVVVKLDYKPKKVDYSGIRSGHTTEFMNFFILDEADMTLRNLKLYGISGFPRLSDTLNDIWMPDIKANQLGGVLAGLAPVKSVVKIGGGVKDLVVIPIREYKKDGRAVRSIQKGAVAFAFTTTNELLKFGAKLAAGTQTLLENAEHALGGNGNLVSVESTSASRNNGNAYRIEEDYDEDDKYYDEMGGGLIRNRLVASSISNLEQSLRFTRNDFDNNNRRYSPSFVSRSPLRSGSRTPRAHDHDEINSESEVEESHKAISLYAVQPINAIEGLKLAYTSLERNLGVARDAVYGIGDEASESGSAQV